MKEHLNQVVQDAASSKAALTIGLGTASAPAWIQIINSEHTQAIIVLIGMLVSLTIIGINVQTFRIRSAAAKLKLRQETLRIALLEEQAKEKGLKV